MPTKVPATAELIALFEKKAATPPPESNRMLARHLQCKESLAAAQYLTEAMERYSGADSQPLAVPSDLLPPLG
jgi:hypothetical protein